MIAKYFTFLLDSVYFGFALFSDIRVDAGVAFEFSSAIVPVVSPLAMSRVIRVPPHEVP